jgi:Arc/MetJ-type ribon-helix-helix transcriptional regulator
MSKPYKMINVRMPVELYDEIKRRQAIANTSMPLIPRTQPTSLSDVVTYLLRSQLGLLAATERLERLKSRTSAEHTSGEITLEEIE